MYLAILEFIHSSNKFCGGSAPWRCHWIRITIRTEVIPAPESITDGGGVCVRKMLATVTSSALIVAVPLKHPLPFQISMSK